VRPIKSPEAARHSERIVNLEELKKERARAAELWRLAGEERAELEKFLMPTFSHEKMLKEQIAETFERGGCIIPMSGDQERRAELWRELEAVQFGCDLCERDAKAQALCRSMNVDCGARYPPVIGVTRPGRLWSSTHRWLNGHGRVALPLRHNAT
jgi:hypothetical protein